MNDWADDATTPQGPVGGSTPGHQRTSVRRRKGPWISGFCGIGRHTWCRETAKVPVKSKPEGFIKCACKTCKH